MHETGLPTVRNGEISRAASNFFRPLRKRKLQLSFAANPNSCKESNFEVSVVQPLKFSEGDFQRGSIFVSEALLRYRIAIILCEWCELCVAKSLSLSD
jgi:hypothetical protein